MKNRIQNIITSMPGITAFEWGNMSSFNLTQDDQVNFPVCLMLPSFERSTPLKGGLVLTIHTVTLLFVTQSELSDDYAITRVTTVDSMRDLAKSFVYYLYQDIKALSQPENVTEWFIHSLNPQDKYDFDAFFNAFDVNVDGVGLTVEIPVREKIEDCLL